MTPSPTTSKRVKMPQMSFGEAINEEQKNTDEKMNEYIKES